MAGQTLTIVFTDVVDSTALAARLGPDRAEHMRRQHAADLTQAVERASGEVVKGMGDGILAVFISVRQALDAAIAMQRTVARRNAEGDELLGLRVGIATGEVNREHDDVHGPAVVIASRLCGTAVGGQIVVADLIRILLAGAGDHTFVPLGALELKGLPDAVDASELQWEAAAADGAVPFPPRLALTILGPLVGREAERREVLAALDDDRRTLVAIAGEPGIGKTRLAGDVARSVHDQDAVVLFARCDDGAPALVPIAAMLGELVAAVGVEHVRALAGEEVSALAGLVPALGEGGAGGDALAAYDAIDALISALASDREVLVVVDDGHWADVATLQVLRHLLRSSRGGRVHVLMTYRDTDLGRRHPLAEVLADLRRDGVVSRTHLAGLPVASVAEMINAQAGPGADHVFVVAIHEETAGNPFFVGEVLTHLAESGAVQRDASGEWHAQRAVDELGIPEGVREVVGRRLSCLADATNNMLLTAAVIGPEFDTGTVAAASGLTVDDVAAALEECLRAGLLLEVGPGRALFRHALIRQTLLEELSATRRVQLHWRISDALAERRSDPAEIAQHAVAGVLAGDPHVAARRAAEGAAALDARLADSSATELGEAALQLLDDHGIDDMALRYEIEFTLANASFSGASGIAGARAHYVAAAGIARETGDPQRLIRAAILSTRWLRMVRDDEMLALIAEALEIARERSPDDAIRLLIARAMQRQAFGDTTGASADATEAAELAEREDVDPRIRAAARNFPVLASPLTVPIGDLDLEFDFDMFDRGPLAWHTVALRHAVVAPARRGDRLGWDTAVTAFLAASVRPIAALLIPSGYALGVALLNGHLSAYKATLVADRDGLPVEARSFVNFALLYDDYFRAVRVEEGRADLLIERLLAVIDDLPQFTHLRPCLATQLASVGRVDEASQQLDYFCERQTEGLSHNFLVGPTLRFLAEAAALCGHESTVEWLDPSLARFAGEMMVYGYGTIIEGAVDRARGQCALVRGDLDASVTLLEAGLRLEEGFDAPALAARSRYWLAKALLERRPSDHERADELLTSCAAFAERSGMRLLHEHASVLLDRGS